jgi:DNA-binding NtrC family response regulator
MESAGHRVIESGGFGQAQLLVSSGLDPDLILVESSSEHPVETVQIRDLLQCVPTQNLCLILGVGEERLRREALALGLGSVLTKPLTRRDVELVIEALISPETQVSCDESSVPSTETRAVAAAASAASAPMPSVLQMEELGENGYFLAASPGMVEIHSRAKMVAGTDVNVLILGESGTGKEVIAHLIHKHSRRSRYRLHKVNCAALPEQLLESELFV